MDTMRAAQFVSSLALMPGWQAEAMPVSMYSVAVQVGVATTNSNERYAPRYEGDPFTAASDPVLIDVSRMDEADLAIAVLRLCVEKAEHEMREFTRYYDPASGRWLAPAHPHRPEGIAAWEAAVQRTGALR